MIKNTHLQERSPSHRPGDGQGGTHEETSVFFLSSLYAQGAVLSHVKMSVSVAGEHQHLGPFT